MRHFFTLGAQREQQATCPHGLKSMSLLTSEQTRHSSRAELLSLLSCDGGSIWSLEGGNLSGTAAATVHPRPLTYPCFCDTWPAPCTSSGPGTDPAASALSCFLSSSRLRSRRGSMRSTPRTSCPRPGCQGSSTAGKYAGKINGIAPSARTQLQCANSPDRIAICTLANEWKVGLTGRRVASVVKNSRRKKSLFK